MDLKPYPQAVRLRRALDLRPGLSVLDVGGGTGAVEAKARLPDVVLADPQPAMLRRARPKGIGLRPVLADGARLPFRSGAFDRVLMVDALHHVADQDGALAEMARVLAPGGRLVVEEIRPRSAFGRFVRALEWLGRFHSRFLEPDELWSRVEAQGLSGRVELWSSRTYAVVADKPGGRTPTPAGPASARGGGRRTEEAGAGAEPGRTGGTGAWT